LTATGPQHAADTMPRVRRLLGAVAVAFLLCGALVTPPALAQDTAVSLRLVSQSPWVEQYDRHRLHVELLAFNGGSTTLRHLQVDVSFGEHIATQDAYDAMLSTTPTTFIATDVKDVAGEIAPGDTTSIQMNVDLESIGELDQIDSQVYPVLIQLVSEQTAVASLLTPVIYLVHEPVAPMLSTTWVDLSAPIAFGADGTLVDAAFPASIAEGGALRAPLDAIEAATGGRHPHGSLDLVLDPLLITQARDLQDGYRSSDGTDVADTDPTAQGAAKFLTRLATATSHPTTLETIAQPYANPVLPAMLNSEPDLEAELHSERDAGQIIVESLGPTPAEGPRSTPSVARPVDGRLSDDALSWLSAEGSNIVLGNADTVDRTPYQGIYAPSPIVPMPSGTMVLPDPSTQALFARTDLFSDPVRAAQIVLGELAVIWKQQPAPTEPTQRGIVIAPPSTLPPDLWRPLLTRLTDAPFLDPVTATQLVQKIVPDPSYANPETPLASQDTSLFSPEYAASIDATTRSTEAYASMLPEGDQTPTDLRRRLLLATAAPYLLDESSGQPWISSVQDTTRGAFAAVAPGPPPGSNAGNISNITLTSRQGTIPIQMGDPGATPLHVIVQLQSTSFTFAAPGAARGNPQDVVLTRPAQVVAFDVVAQGSGQNPIDVVVRAPNGTEIARTRITVRSTAVNRIALFVTLGAALGLVALYGRRWVRRRRKAAT